MEISDGHTVNIMEEMITRKRVLRIRKMGT